MTSLYQELICELKIKLKNKKINFNKICSLINNQFYDEIIKIIDDDVIHNLITKIVAERTQIGNKLETKLNNLLWLNEQLIQFGEEPQTSITKALKILKSNVFINIYDLEREQYEKRTTMQLLRKELRKQRDRRFPLSYAKENITLKSFLIKL
jgi:hypothetical protein